MRGAFEQQAPPILGRWLADDGGEDAMEVEQRHVRVASEVRQAQRPLELPFNAGNRAHDALAITQLGRRAHLPGERGGMTANVPPPPHARADPRKIRKNDQFARQEGDSKPFRGVSVGILQELLLESDGR